MMTTATWAKVRPIVEEALMRPVPERHAYVEQSCGDDADLKAEVSALLQAHARAEVVGALESPFEGDAPAFVPERLGPFRVDRQLGEGGMARVYLAERADGLFEQRAAIKILKRGADTAERHQRFRYERQILAQINHPNIARLYDGGQTEDGRPYFVMEYVEGEPVTQYCDRRRLSIKDRLQLFCNVCDAVAFAHRNLVIHRDLKPSNILVTQNGEIKLLDFGIAKLIDTAAPDEPFTATRTGFRWMTPEYAAPEQIRGESITTATDIYQLGMLLYELLTGRLPFRLHEQLPHEIELSILSEEPTRPSVIVRQTGAVEPGRPQGHRPEELSLARNAEPGRLQRLLAGDLDTIVLAALKKEPERRYSSVEQFAQDIQRYLRGQPVLARPDSVAYRLSKFVRRHKAGAAAGTAFVAVLMGFILVLMLQQAAVVLERDRARTEAEKAARINEFLHHMIASADPYEEGPDITVVAILDRALDRVGTELEGQPEVEAAVRRTIAVTYQHLGNYEQAREQFGAALELRRSSGGNAMAVAESVNDLALVNHYLADYAAADTLYRQAISLFESENAHNVRFATALNAYGTYFQDLGRHRESADLFERALAIEWNLHAGDTKNKASILNNLGIAYHYLGDIDAAERNYRDALEMNRRMGRTESVDYGHTLNNLSFVLVETGDLSGAEALLAESLEIRRARFGDIHPAVAVLLGNLVSVHRLQGEYHAAESLAHEAIHILEASLPPEHEYRGRALLHLGRVYLESDRAREAEHPLREAHRILAGALSEQHWRAAHALTFLGQSLALQGRNEEAEPLLRRSLHLLESDPDAYAEYVDDARAGLALLPDLSDPP